jgi:hypothetical protein
MLGERGKGLLNVIDAGAHTFFNMVRIVMYVPSLGAFGAIAFTIGRYGAGSLASYGQLLGTYYLTRRRYLTKRHSSANWPRAWQTSYDKPLRWKCHSGRQRRR